MSHIKKWYTYLNCSVQFSFIFSLITFWHNTRLDLFYLQNCLNSWFSLLAAHPWCHAPIPHQSKSGVLAWIQSKHHCVSWTTSQDLMAVENIWVKWTHCYAQETSVLRSWVQCSGRMWCLLSVQGQVQRKYSHYPITPLKHHQQPILWFCRNKSPFYRILMHGLNFRRSAIVYV